MINRIFKKTLCIATAMMAIACADITTAEEPYTEGMDYQVIQQPSTLANTGKIEVREFFWYGCPHCYRLDPYVQTWKKTKPADVNFVYTPAALNDVWAQNARGYYATEAMGLADKLHTPLFNAIHKEGLRLFDQASLGRFYAKQGVNQATFNKNFYSAEVTEKVAQSKQLAMQYQLGGVPALVVNGKYVVSGEDGKALQVVDYLINKERALKTQKKAS